MVERHCNTDMHYGVMPFGPAAAAIKWFRYKTVETILPFWGRTVARVGCDVEASNARLYLRCRPRILHIMLVVYEESTWSYTVDKFRVVHCSLMKPKIDRTQGWHSRHPE